MYAYNLFQSTKPDGLVCAVPEERTVPPFVVGPHWRFGGRVQGQDAPLGFDRKAAKSPPGQQVEYDDDCRCPVEHFGNRVVEFPV